ncbi:MAG: hypothetical protein LBS46_02825 [Dysgonamonadaceae bacterium]|nr:hypothetical protein [Dysgonamonadaceae bacterium]
MKSQRSNAWNTATRNATAPQNRTVHVLYLRGAKVATFLSSSECENEKQQLKNIVSQMLPSSNSDEMKQPATKGRDHLENVLLRKKAEADAKTRTKKAETDAKNRQELLASVEHQCACRSENNPHYTSNAKSGDSGYGDLFTPAVGETDKDSPSNSLFADNPQTQYENIFDAPSARTSIRTNTDATQEVSVNFDNIGAYTGSGIRVGNPNWKSDWQTPVEIEESDYTINKFDAIKKEIAIDLRFRNEVAISIQAFLENRTSSIPQLLRDLYRERTGFDIEDLRNRKNLTDEEREIAEDYNHFVKQMAIELDYQANEAKKNPNPEKRLIDNAIMANDIYEPGSKGLKDTDWHPLTSSWGIEDKTIAQTIDAINRFNEDGSGFYAQMYKNELTGEYTLAFRGSNLNNLSDINDWVNNAMQGFSILNPQYANAAIIGQMLSDCKEKINIVGHSLGGGLATVAGLKTGFPTYTYNQADISQGTVDKYKLDVSKSDNITAYYTDGEILTTLQNETRDYNTLIPLGQKIKTGSVAPTEESKTLSVISKTADVAAIFGVPYSEFTAKAATVINKGIPLVAMLDGHRMPHTEQHLRSIYGESQVRWEGYNNVQLVLRNNNTYSNLLINTK